MEFKKYEEGNPVPYEKVYDYFNPEKEPDYKQVSIQRDGTQNLEGCNILEPIFYRTPDGSHCYVFTDEGGANSKYSDQRVKNQDAFGVRVLTDLEEKDLILDEVAIADGVGSTENSHLAASEITKSILERKPTDIFSDENFGLEYAIRRGIHMVRSKTPDGYSHPSTCLIYYKIDNGGNIEGVTVGDPQMLIVWPEAWKSSFETNPQNIAHWEYRGNYLNRTGYFNHNAKNQVFNTINCNKKDKNTKDNTLQEHFKNPHPLTPGTLIITASDGLWDIIDTFELADIIKGLNGKEAMHAIQNLVLNARNKKFKSCHSETYTHFFDNITVHVREYKAEESAMQKHIANLSEQENQWMKEGSKMGSTALPDFPEESQMLRDLIESLPVKEEEKIPFEDTDYPLAEKFLPLPSDESAEFTSHSKTKNTLSEPHLSQAPIIESFPGDSQIIKVEDLKNEAEEKKWFASYPEQNTSTEAIITEEYKIKIPSKIAGNFKKFIKLLGAGTAAATLSILGINGFYKKKNPVLVSSTSTTNNSIPYKLDAGQEENQETTDFLKNLPTNPNNNQIIEILINLKDKTNSQQKIATITKLQNFIKTAEKLGIVDLLKEIAINENIEPKAASNFNKRLELFGNNYEGSSNQNEILKKIVLQTYLRCIYKSVALGNNQALKNFLDQLAR